MIKTIIEVNQIRELVKLDPYIARGVNVCFPRVCIFAENADLMNCKVVVPDEEGKPHDVWCEEFSNGRGFWGEEGHDFAYCILWIAHKKVNAPVLQKQKNSKSRFFGYGKEKAKFEGEWQTVNNSKKWKKHQYDDPNPTKGKDAMKGNASFFVNETVVPYATEPSKTEMNCFGKVKVVNKYCKCYVYAYSNICSL